ncbi:hypothetical protein AWB83_00970 [Caballeronia ptereochthonis]|uniref:Uncharacterized protein n=1 Tax=Caballeronia ptereochthonis TaxID=1777144 RepID=A0A157ZRQ2_9BURK|nr:hypothetical protein AWB83_00970 [Caballeronia ptereochthonis]
MSLADPFDTCPSDSERTTSFDPRYRNTWLGAYYVKLPTGLSAKEARRVMATAVSQCRGFASRNEYLECQGFLVFGRLGHGIGG